MLLLIVLTLLVLTLICFKVLKIYRYWDEKGVPYIKPVPVFGNMFSTIVLQKSLHSLIRKIYDAYPNERYVGVYQFGTPVLLIRDLDLLKRLTVKEFDTFPDHTGFVPGSDDYISNYNMFALRVEDGWHNIRGTLSPAFTGSKMKAMFILMEECANQFVDYFNKQKSEIVTVELKDTFSRFTNDVIGTTAFGVTCNSLEDKDNQFYRLGKELANFGGVQFLKFIGDMFFQKLMVLMKIKYFNEDATHYFSKIIRDSLKMRAEQGIIRLDMIHLMMEAKDGSLSHEAQDNNMGTGFAANQDSDLGKSKRSKRRLNDDDIVAQAILFFIAGFDPASTTMCYACYELARNPEIQQRLYTEIRDFCDEKLVYETVLGLKYLDCVVAEILRKWSSGSFVDRVCVRPFTIEPERPHEKPLHLDAGQVIWIPLGGVHKDPKYHPDPDKFDPERFNEENKKNMHPCSFIPFGIGPRYCLGSRFALLEIKIILIKLLQNFEIVPVENTPDCVAFGSSSIVPVPDNDIMVGFKRRGSS